MTILGILGTMVIPQFGSTNVLRTQAAVRTIVADITFAQSDALSYQQSRAVMFDPDENMYTLVEVNGATLDADLDALYDSQGPGQRYRVDLDDMDFGGAFIQNVSFNGGNDLIFDEIGGARAGRGGELAEHGGVARGRRAAGDVPRQRGTVHGTRDGRADRLSPPGPSEAKT